MAAMTPAAPLRERLPALGRQLAVVSAVLIALLSIPALAYYPGSLWLAVLFCVVSGGLVPLVIVIGRSPFRQVIGIFLALGFWAKFVAHFAIGARLVEPLGRFPFTPAAWDTALLFATAGLAGVWAALLATSRLGPVAPRVSAAPGALAAPEAPASPAARAPSRRIAGPADRRMLMLLAVSAAVALIVFALNYRFAILRIGFVPFVTLPRAIYMPIAFAVTWGVLLWALGLAWWLIERGLLPPKAIMHIAAFEGSAAALSIGSRGQMLLHLIAGALALWHGWRWHGWRLSRRDWIEMTAVLVPLFVATLLLVSVARAVDFSKALTASVPVTKYVPQTPRQAVVTSVPTQLRQLVVLRWVGLDGVLATAGARQYLGLPLLQRALVESPAAGVDALFQRMSGAGRIYARSDKVVFLTIPGPVAFASFGGSPLWSFFILLGLIGCGTLLEYGAGRVTGNPAIAAVIGVALAYLLVQLNFPRTLLVFVIEAVIAVLILAVIGWRLRPPGDGTATDPRHGRG